VSRRAGANGLVLALLLTLVTSGPLSVLAQPPAPPAPPPGGAQPPAPAPPPAEVPGVPAPGRPPTEPVTPSPPVPTAVPPPPGAVPEPPPEVRPTPPRPTIPSAPVLVFPAVGAPGAPPTTTFELHPSVRLTEEFTDNFLQTGRDRRENFRTSLSPGLTLLINSPLTKGTVAYNLSLAHDSSTDDVSHFHSLLGRVSWQATPLLTLTVTDVLTRSDEPSQADRLSLRRERRTFTGNTFSVEADYLLARMSARPYYRLSTFFDEDGSSTVTHTAGTTVSATFYQATTATLGYEYLTSQTTDGADLSGHQVTASLSRRLSPFASAGISAGYSWRHEADTGGTGRDFEIGNVSLFGVYAIPGRWSINGSVGVSRLLDERGNDHLLLSTAAGLSYRFARATATLGVDRGFSESFAQGQNFGVVETQGVTASLTYPVTPALVGAISAFYRENEFTGLGVEGRGRGRKEDVWGAAVSVSVRLLSWLGLEAEYRHEERSGSTLGAQGGFTENRARLSLFATF
jgi:hypothetical protein